jgi:hypothetical protein
MKGMAAVVAAAAVGVVAVLYVAVAVIIGGVAEHDVEADLAKVPPSLLIEKHYQRGWFQSELDATVSLPAALLRLPGAPAETQAAMKLHAVIQHGPLCGFGCFGLTRTQLTLEPTGSLASAAARVYGGKPPLAGTSTASFFGETVLTLVSPPSRDGRFADGMRMSSEGFTIQARGYRKSARGEFHWSEPQMVIHTDSSQTEISSLKLDGSVEPLEAGAYENASARFSMGRLHVQDLTGQLTPNAFSIPAMHVDLALHHLQRKALEDYQRQVQAANTERQADGAAAGAAALAALQTAAQHLLANQPELVLDAGLTLQDGRLQVTGTLNAPDLHDADEVRVGPALVESLQLKLTISIDDGAVQGYPGSVSERADLIRSLEKLVNKGYASHDSGRYQTAFLFAHGRMTMNNRPLSSAAELMALMR